MPAPPSIEELVQRFTTHRDVYRSEEYNEAQLRQEFLNPWFEALGWDVYNRKNYAESYKEVIFEAAIRVGSRTKAPDYCFRAGGGKPSFFVEAKRPAVDVAEAVEPAYQLRRYGWSAKLPVSILTDFEEFAVYDCRIRPAKTDKAAAARIMLLPYTEYVPRWDELVGLFSPEAIRQGALERFVASKKVKKGTVAVDQAFLAEIEGWREELAKNIALRNVPLEPRDLNFAVQRTIDRLVFLRICEDRGIELYGTLEKLLGMENVYRALAELFQRADDRYNSGLFHFAPEPQRSEPPDELTLKLAIDDRPLKEIIRNLYYPDSPYEFSVISAEILGQVYEQFLGKVIRLTAGHQAKVEEKPEVRKAGGVYYTPGYIVDYIVEQTVGKLLARKTPRGVAKLRILDPACGSGSFLLGAYQYLLDWHRDWYVGHGAEKHARGRSPRLYRSPEGDWRLTTPEKKRILLNNVYGVDIDPQAVEVTKLSLLLKVLEGESKETVNNQLRLIHERPLPDLGENIKCGNSLIGPDFYEGRQMTLFEVEEQLRINAFDWKSRQTGFGKITAAGGFDAVIANPPWVMAGYYLGPELQYLKDTYESARGKFDLYYLFLEAGTRLLKDTGELEMIVPNKFFHTRAAANLRKYLSDGRMVHAIVDFGCARVFDGPTNYSCILLLRKTPSAQIRFTRAAAGLSGLKTYRFSWKHLHEGGWHFARPKMRALFQKVKEAGIPLEGLVKRFGTGVQSGADRVLLLEARAVRKLRLERRVLRSFLRGRDVRRYQVGAHGRHLVFPYCEEQGQFVIYPESALRAKFPRAYAYLSENKVLLSKRVWFGKKARQLSGHWYGMMYVDAAWAFESPHILTPSLSNRSNFTLGQGPLFATGTAGVTSIIPEVGQQMSILYLLGSLNSKLLSLYITAHSPIFQGSYHKFSAPYLKQTPIRPVDFADRKDKARHDRMVALVEAMLMHYQRLEKARGEHEQTVLRRQIETTDRQIDQLVYELYGLSDEEIALVEAAEKAEA